MKDIRSQEVDSFASTADKLILTTSQWWTVLERKIFYGIDDVVDAGLASDKNSCPTWWISAIFGTAKIKFCPNYFCRRDKKKHSKRVLNFSIPNRFSRLKQLPQSPTTYHTVSKQHVHSYLVLHSFFYTSRLLSICNLCVRQVATLGNYSNTI